MTASNAFSLGNMRALAVFLAGLMLAAAAHSADKAIASFRV
jgi:hypothetical protein